MSLSAQEHSLVIAIVSPVLFALCIEWTVAAWADPSMLWVASHHAR